MADFDPDAYLADTPDQPSEGSPTPEGAFDPDAYLRDFNPDEYLKTKPEAEGLLPSVARSAAHGVVPAAGAFAGMGAGASLGAAAAPFLGPLAPAGPIVGGLIGGIAGGLAGDVAQEKIQDTIPAIDDRPQLQANQEARPITTAIAGMAPMAGAPGKLAGSAITRLASAGIMGGIEAGEEAYQGNGVDPAKVASVAAFGAAFPNGNRVGNMISDKAATVTQKFVPGRPGRTANPDAAQAHADVRDNSVETAVGDSALAESPPTPTGETIGARDDNKPTNSQGEIATGEADGSYAKAPQAGDQSQITTGDIAPDVGAALKSEEPATPPVQRPLGMPQGNYKPPQPEVPTPQPVAEPAPEARPAPEPVVDTGMPKEGEPVAVGENEATPLPENFAEIMKPISAPEITGETAQPTQGQAEAGNYKKARTMDFGKKIAIETRAGETRKGKGWEHELPYDYGYFNNTKGPDGDHIDFVRPKEGSPEMGDKHFIIDQKNETTGKYDEPKVFTYLKDKDAAVDLYNRGFGDGKGPQRMHDITEVSRADLTKYLARYTTKAPTKPYGKPIPVAPKPVKERAVFKDLIEKKPELAEALKAAPDEVIAQAIEGKRTRKYGVKGGYPVEGLVNEAGEPVTAKDKKLAAERSASHKKVADWFEKSSPKGEETNGQLLDRIKSHPYPKQGEWAPTFKTKEWLLAKAARDAVSKPTPGNIAKYRDAERLLRSGDERAIDAYRGGNRVEADIARSRRTGDEAIAGAEAEAARTGRNDEEERMLENIGRQRGDFDVPHEEAEEMVKPRPVKTKADIKERKPKEIDVRDTKLAQKPVGKQTLAELTAAPKPAPKKEEFTPVEKASEGKSVKGKFSAEDMQRFIDLSNKTAGRKGLSDEEINRDNIFRQFARDESGALRPGQIKNSADALTRYFNRAFKVPDVMSYRAADYSSPTNRYASRLSDELHINDNLNTMHKLLNQRKLENLGRVADRAALERIYKAREADSAHVDLPGKQPGKSNIESLAPKDIKVWDEHIKPLLDETEAFANHIRQLDPDRIGPMIDDYIARIAKGDTSEYNLLRQQEDPTGTVQHGLSVNAGQAKERAFTVLERNADKKRFVVMERPNGFTLWDAGKGIRIKDPTYGFEANQPYTVKGKNGNVDYTMRHATADEIERSGASFDLGKGKTQKAKYYQNAGFSAVMAHTNLGIMARNLQELARITSSKEFMDRSTRNADTAREKGYIETKFPNMKGTYMDPRLAHLFDDYARPGVDLGETIRNLSHGVTKMLFWMPVAHIANVGTHWGVGRGWDWLTPMGMHRLAVTTPKAIKSVINQDVTQQRLMASGASLIYPTVKTRRFIEASANAVGEEMIRNPSKYGPLADAFNVSAEKIGKYVYDNSSKIMWMANDMFLTQRVLELQAKGLSTDQAIKQTERDIPNYRVPPQFFTGNKSGKMADFGRNISRLVQSPELLSFGRYHYGMLNSYAGIFKGAFGKDATPGERLEAAGKLVALGIIAFGVYPIMDKFAQKVTGNEDAEQQRRGPLTIPTHLAKAAQGKEDVAAAARSTTTLPPLVTTVLETLNNKDWRGKSIVEPGDVQAGVHGDLKRGGRALVQEAEHAARGLVSPYGTFSTSEKKADEPGAAGIAKAAGRAVRDQALDVKNPSEASRKFARKQDIINDKNSRQREKKGGYGPLEEGFNKLFGN